MDTIDIVMFVVCLVAAVSAVSVAILLKTGKVKPGPVWGYSVGPTLVFGASAILMAIGRMEHGEASIQWTGLGGALLLTATIIQWRQKVRAESKLEPHQ